MTRPDTAAARRVLAQRVAAQAKWCDDLGSPFYASLLRSAAKDLESENAVWGVLEGYEGEDGRAALPLRLMGAVHRLVLAGDLPELASRYPSVGGDGDDVGAWPAFRQALVEHRSQVRDLLGRGCQTNEVGRCAALLGGFLAVSQRSGLPLRLLEIGASAGLNLRWDRYRYEVGDQGWGDPTSPVRFVDRFEVPPPLDVSVDVVERRGCDLNPVDPTSGEGSLSLRSFIWADQLERFRLLEGAIEVARQVPADVQRLDAGIFLERELASSRVEVATVVYHSVFIVYVDEQGRERISRAIESAAARATPQAPLAYLRMELGGEGTFEVRLRMWPGSGDELLGLTGAHGTGVRWLA